MPIAACGGRGITFLVMHKTLDPPPTLRMPSIAIVYSQHGQYKAAAAGVIDVYLEMPALTLLYS